MQKEYIIFILNSRRFEISPDFNDFSDVNQNIYSILVAQHKYHVKSNVSKQTFQSFIDHWVNKKNPKINMNNISEYELLSQEFDRMKDIIQMYHKHSPNCYASSLIIHNQELYTQIAFCKDQLKKNQENYQKIINSYLNNKKVDRSYSDFEDVKRDIFFLSKRENANLIEHMIGKKTKQNGFSFFLNEGEKTAGLYHNFNKGDILLPTTIICDSNEYTITQLFERAFSISRVKSIQFQADSKLQKIDQNAFANANFESITIPPHVTRIENYTFSEKQQLQSVKFQPNSELKYIGKDAFNNSSITELDLPSGIEDFCDGWCDSTYQLKKINIIQSDKQNIMLFDGKFVLGKSNLKSDTFDVLLFAPRNIKTATIPSCVKTIAPFAFNFCNDLETVIFSPNSKLTTICHDAFSCSSLKKLKIPSSVSDLKYCWCYKTTNLNDIEIDETSEVNISKLNEQFIVGKSDQKSDVFDVILFAPRNIKIVKIPSFITKIDSLAFYECRMMKKVEFDEESNITIFDKFSFSNSSLTSITIPQKVTHICDSTFSACNNLKRVNFHSKSKLKHIGISAFQYSSVERLKIPRGVTFLGNSAFFFCTRLKSVEFDEKSELAIIDAETFAYSPIESVAVPSSVTTINLEAFAYCQHLNIIDFGCCENLLYVDKRILYNSSIKIIMAPANSKPFKLDIKR